MRNIGLTLSIAVITIACGIRPLPPIGCGDGEAVCICDENNNCSWSWICR